MGCLRVVFAMAVGFPVAWALGVAFDPLFSSWGALPRALWWLVVFLVIGPTLFCGGLGIAEGRGGEGFKWLWRRDK